MSVGIWKSLEEVAGLATVASFGGGGSGERGDVTQSDRDPTEKARCLVVLSLVGARANLVTSS